MEGVSWLTTEQMVEVDRAMMQDYRILLIQMMENAGRNLAHLARARFLGGDPRGRAVTVMAGAGGNGGGALVAARRLAGWGAEVTVLLAQEPEAMTEVPAHQRDVLARMGVAGAATPLAPEAVGRVELVLDGLIGYSLRGAPSGRAAALIVWANGCGAPVLALDVPSGVDAAGGTVFEPAIEATATMTLALPKLGLRSPAAARRVGELYLADISVPPALYAGLGLTVGPLFAQDDIIRIA